MKDQVVSQSPILKVFLVLVCLSCGLTLFYDYTTGTNIAFALFVPVRHLVEGIYQMQIFKPSGESSSVPIRGSGDSYLPFEDGLVPQLNNFSKEDLYKEKPKGVDPPDPDNPPLKKILFWNIPFTGGGLHFGFGFGHEPFVRAGCRVNTCMTTGERDRFPLEDIDAVVWGFRSPDRSMPSKRSPHTRYIFWMTESASHLDGNNISDYNNVFNWTFTYRLDSDFPDPYGVVYRRRDPLPVKITQNITAGKTKLAAWFVSHCNSIGGRDNLVNALMKWMKIDVYGQCGNLKCASINSTFCFKMLERDYKFYFSFENSLCKDYVTEKFFKILPLYVVPVVYGLGNYSWQAPPHSYINALDFPSAKDLAQYLLYLDKNDTAYNEYFQWKPYHNLWAQSAKPWCDVCERLHTDGTKKVYDLSQWFVKDSHCLNSQSPKILNLIKS